MTKYVALLRGIGPTNPNMKSENLKAFFIGLGFSNVQTLITSGNVIFESDSTDISSLETKIEEALPLKLGFSSTTLIRSQAELQSIVDKGPYNKMEHGQTTYLLVTFFKRSTELPFKLPYQPKGKPYKIISGTNTILYGVVDVANGKTTDYMAWLEGQFTKDLASRTWNTVQRILIKMKSS